MFERFTNESRQVVVLAQEVARNLGHAHIGTEHLLLGLLSVQGSPIGTVLTGLDLTYGTAEAAVRELVPPSSRPPGGHIPFTPRSKKTLELSLREALHRGDDHIGPEHLLLGLLAEGEGVAAQVLRRGGRTLDEVRAAVLATMGPGGGVKPTPIGRRTPAAEQVLTLAEKLAAGAPLGSHHLLEALAAVDSGLAGRALAGMGVTGETLAASIDAIDVHDTTDATPEQAAAATMSLSADAATVTLTCTDSQLVGRLRGLVEQAGGPLTGDGVLAGPFIGLHRALVSAAASIDAVLNPREQPPSDEPGTLTTLLERLRRMRRGG